MAIADLWGPIIAGWNGYQPAINLILVLPVEAEGDLYEETANPAGEYSHIILRHYQWLI